MKRENAGYEIITAVRISPVQEIVIGHRPTAPEPYVCWYCINCDNYEMGKYSSSYRSAMKALAERIMNIIDIVPVDMTDALNLGDEVTFTGKKTGLMITITRYGQDDYCAWWRDESEINKETAGYSVRGTLLDIVSEIKEEV